MESEREYFGSVFPRDPTEASWGSLLLSLCLPKTFPPKSLGTACPLMQVHTQSTGVPLPTLPPLAPTPHAVYSYCSVSPSRIGLRKVILSPLLDHVAIFGALEIWSHYGLQAINSTKKEMLSTMWQVKRGKPERR